MISTFEGFCKSSRQQQAYPLKIPDLVKYSLLVNLDSPKPINDSNISNGEGHKTAITEVVKTLIPVNDNKTILFSQTEYI